MKKISALAIAGVMTASLAATAFAESDVKVGGEIRLRDQWQNNSDYNKDLGDGHNYIVQRTRLNVDAKIDEKTKAYVSLQNNRNWGFGSGIDSTVPGKTGNGDTVSVYQAYVQLDKLFDQPLTFKAGRQKIALGNHRLVGANDWGIGQTFDAWILAYNNDAVSAALFSNTATDGNGAAGTDTKNNGLLNGLYVTVKSVPVTSLDVYAIQKYAIASQGENLMTFGVRANGAAAGFDWDAEAALQSGDSSATVKKSGANAVWLLAGYTIPEVSKLRIGAEFDQLSGTSSTDTDDKSFDFYVPTKHSISKQRSFYGVTDKVEALVGTSSTTGKPQQGLRAISINASAEPVAGLQLLAEYWNYSTPQEYAAGKTSIGNEMNLQVWYGISKSTTLHAYYAQLTPTTDWKTKQDAFTDAVLQLEVKF